ncbi:hypothetical protein HanIR_Chr03g0102881 [Helianthus annuus]|nr:hypothetical protein HanIR_Chr03g0102881 [Helianthus annuus]
MMISCNDLSSDSTKFEIIYTLAWQLGWLCETKIYISLYLVSLRPWWCISFVRMFTYLSLIMNVLDHVDLMANIWYLYI